MDTRVLNGRSFGAAFIPTIQMACTSNHSINPPGDKGIKQGLIGEGRLAYRIVVDVPERVDLICIDIFSMAQPR